MAFSIGNPPLLFHSKTKSWLSNWSWLPFSYCKQVNCRKTTYKQINKMIFLLNKNTIWRVYAFFKMSFFCFGENDHDFKCPVHTGTCLTQFYATVFKNPRCHLFARQSKSIFKMIVLRNSPPTKPLFDGVLGRFVVKRSPQTELTLSWYQKGSFGIDRSLCRKITLQ